jgi:hypothetical protein
LWITPYQFLIPAETPDRSWSLTTPNEISALQVFDTSRAKQEPIDPEVEGSRSHWLSVP